MIKNIVFDFGGVLVKYDFKAFFRQHLPSKEETEWFMRHAFEPINNELDLGIESPEDIIGRAKRMWPEYEEVFQAFLDHYEDIFLSEIKGMTKLMKELKAKGYRLLGLSNWSCLVERIMKKFPRPFALLDGMLISKDEHIMKPSQKIYRRFCLKFGVKPEECVFIDDKPENVLAAESMYLYGIVFHDINQLRRDLDILLQPYRIEIADEGDVEDCWQVVHECALDMQARGSKQWNDGYPDRETIVQDIKEQKGYLLRIDGRVAAYACITLDGEAAYEERNGFLGQWLPPSGMVPHITSDSPSLSHRFKGRAQYVTIHRSAVALDFRGRGLSKLLFWHAECLARYYFKNSVRFDTNYDNSAMLHLGRKLGYTRTGLCQYQKGERICFEKLTQ